MLLLKHRRIEILDQNTIILQQQTTKATTYYIKKFPLMKYILFQIGPERRRKARMPPGIYY
ncbi:hypothetical protein ES332_D08G136600v1 [Gossypium tomentosum]|uniref:Uncharacterized protein n=1 Tax=Gossypium tomentosum TaxID=34277 RepID=A0A5D2JU00_GOSTO|nr:hypothetical protein ES332_D08G136600v1 [Gossypium tomentosum]